MSPLVLTHARVVLEMARVGLERSNYICVRLYDGEYVTYNLSMDQAEVVLEWLSAALAGTKQPVLAQGQRRPVAGHDAVDESAWPPSGASVQE